MRIDCPKCDGRGTLNAFQSIENGRCFMCGGAGWFASADKKLSAEQLLRIKALWALAIFCDE